MSEVTSTSAKLLDAMGKTLDIMKIKTGNKMSDYITVHSRVKVFRQCIGTELGIDTNKISSGEFKSILWNFSSKAWEKDNDGNYTPYDGEWVIFKAVIKDLQGNVIASGWAKEVDDSRNFINKTSLYENCETSAIGRALACLGIGIDNSYASANEVTQAIDGQNNPPIPPKKKDSTNNKDTFQKVDKKGRDFYGDFPNGYPGISFMTTEMMKLYDDKIELFKSNLSDEQFFIEARKIIWTDVIAMDTGGLVNREEIRNTMGLNTKQKMLTMSFNEAIMYYRTAQKTYKDAGGDGWDLIEEAKK